VPLTVLTAIGPGARIDADGTFESFHVFELVQDSTDRERRGLGLRRAYRALAPLDAGKPCFDACAQR